jgi:uncharacterized protein DUF3857
MLSFPFNSAISEGEPIVRSASLGRPRPLGALIWVLAIGLPLKSSQKQASPDTWPAITAEQFALKDDPSNPGAKAVMLEREVTTDDTKSTELHYCRIKILTEGGKKYADIEIPYVDKMFRIEEVKARTVQPDGKTTDFNGQIFDKLVAKAKRVKVQVKTFTLPDVRVGSIIEYSYTLQKLDKPPDVLRHPEGYIITQPVIIPTARWTIQEELSTRHARFAIRPLPRITLRSNARGFDQASEIRQQPDGATVLELTNIAAFQEEEFMPPAEMLKSRVYFFYRLGAGVDAESFWREHGKRWAEVWEKFIGNFKDVQRVVEQTISPDDAPETKLRKLYDRAQQIRFVSFERPRSEKEDKAEGLKENRNVADVLKHGYGFANEINLLFVAFARAAGFESAPVRVASRDERFFDPQLFDTSQLTASVVWVRVGTKDYYLDPATLYCPFGLLPWPETDTAGISVRKEGGVQVTTPAPISANAVIERKASLHLDREGTLQGNLEVTFTGHEALERRLDNRDKDEAARRKSLQEEVQSWLPPGSNAELKRVDRWEQARSMLSADFSIKVPNLATVAGRRLLLPAGIFQATKAHPFQNARRIHPVYFPYPYQVIDDLTLELADGQKMEDLPAPRYQVLSYGSYQISCQNQGGRIEVHRKMVMDGIFFKVEYYPVLRAFFDSVRAGDEQQMVLQNAPAVESAVQH